MANRSTAGQHQALSQRMSLTVPFSTSVDAAERAGSATSEHSVVGVVAPSPVGSVRNFVIDRNSSARRTSNYLPPTEVFITQGQAALLSKITKPFDANCYKALKARIAERKKKDQEALNRMDLGEAKLVDGNIVMDSQEKLEHDPKLADGKLLPKPVGAHFPRNLFGLPVEDVDPRHREYDETFIVITRSIRNQSSEIARFSASPSMYIFQAWNPFRRLAIYAYTHPLFDLVVVCTILANSLYMAMNVDEEVPEYTFLAIYTIEALIKSIAKGVVLSQFTYLRDPWNWLDFIVLITAYATIIAQSVSTSTSVNVNALRTFRVFRVLKTVAIVPGLKTIIEALLTAFANLGNVLVMTLFFFTIFGLFGVQMYQGVLMTKCVLNADAAGVTLVPDYDTNGTRWGDWVSNPDNWDYQDDGWQYTVCGNYSMAQACRLNHTCILVKGSPNPNKDFTKFDDFVGAFLIAIQLFNTDYWDFLYHSVVAATGPSAILFFLFGILFLNYYLANLVQAVVVMSYEVDEEEDADEDASEIVAAGKKNGRRFVFDPARLRVIKLGPDARTRSIQSVRSVTERRLGIAEVNPASSNETAAISNVGKPVAIVRPLGSGVVPTPITVTPSPAVNADKDSVAEIKAAMEWPGFENALRYRVKSHPPSMVSEDDLPKIGFWDRNPICCFRCCVGLFPWLKFQHGLMIFVTDPFFDLFITVTIVVNTVSMAISYDGIPDNVQSVLNQINDVCTYIFITECVLKLFTMCGEYFDNKWNWLDFLVVLGSIVDIIMSNMNTVSMGFNTSIIRLLRLLRILKLAQSWKAMRTLLEIIFGTIGAIGNLMLVLVIVMFIFACIGMQLLGQLYTVDKFTPPTGTPTYTPFPGFTGVPEWNWNDFLHSFMIVFRVLCRETWQPMIDCSTAWSFAVCTPIYLVILFIGSYVVLNLFLAVLLNAFSGEDLKKKSADDEDTKLKRRFRAIKVWIQRQIRQIKAQCGKKNNNITPQTADTTQGDDTASTLNADDANTVTELDDEETSDDRRPTTTNTQQTSSEVITIDTNKVQDCCAPACTACCPGFMARFLPNTDSGLRFLKARASCQRITEHKAFEYIILAFIFISSVTLCLQDASLEDDSDLGIALSYMDYVYLGIFTIEMTLKLFGLGLKVYFTSFWTLLDCLIVVTGYLDIIVGELGTSANLSALRALRTLRALRPLRAISRWQGMKIVVNALISAVPGIINVLLVVMIIWLIFAIMGVQFFSGLFYMCVDVPSGNRLPKSLAPDREACLKNPGNWQWVNYPINFDNVAYAYLALFQVATFEGWTTIIQYSIDAPEKTGLQPYPDSNVLYYVYYIVFIVLCSFFLLNLFVGVIIDDFNTLKKRYEGARVLDLFMTDSQKNYYSTIKKLGLKKPRTTSVRPKDAFSIFFYDISISTRMEFAVAGIIGANVAIMATEHFDQDAVFAVVQEVFNVTFTVVFGLEALIKIISLRVHYFRSAWNMFDFSIVIVSILSVALGDLFAAAGVNPSMLRVLRVLRVGRVVRIIRTSKGVRKLMYSLMMSLPALFNIGCLLFLIIFIYAIIGMNLFGHIGHFGGNLDDVANFHNFPMALLTLFRLSTVAGWDNVQQGLSFSDDPATGCNPAVSIEDPNYAMSNPCCNRTAWMRPNGQIVQDNGGGGNCGNFSLSTVYCISYLLFTYFIIVNMFAAVILDFYQEATEQDQIGVTDEDIERFYTNWEQYDPLATQFIKFLDLPPFLASLEPPLRCKKPNDSAIVLLDFPILKDLRTGDEVVHCVDVLMGVVRKALGSIDETEEMKLVKEQLENVFKSAFPNRLRAQHISTTKWRKKQDVAAKTIQRRWRKYKAIREMRGEVTAAPRRPHPAPLNNKVAQPTPASKLPTVTEQPGDGVKRRTKAVNYKQ